MWILISAVFTASLMGSLHCVGMCGPLALWAAGADRGVSSARMFWLSGLYHFGRFLSYAAIGLLAGWLGQVLDWGGDTLGIQLLAARIVGSAMILIGLVALIRIGLPWVATHLLRVGRAQKDANSAAWQLTMSPGEKNTATEPQTELYTPPKPSWLTAHLIRLRPKLFGLPLGLRGLTVGLLTALLPCGWLYLFALLATGTGSAVSGSLLMIAFWLGSVPALVSLVVSSRLLTTPIRRAVPMLVSIMLIIAGAYTATGRGMAELNGRLKVSSSLVEQLHSGRSMDELNASDVQLGMEQLVSTPLPCCQGNGGEPASEVSSSGKQANE